MQRTVRFSQRLLTSTARTKNPNQCRGASFALLVSVGRSSAEPETAMASASAQAPRSKSPPREARSAPPTRGRVWERREHRASPALHELVFGFPGQSRCPARRASRLPEPSRVNPPTPRGVRPISRRHRNVGPGFGPEPPNDLPSQPSDGPSVEVPAQPREESPPRRSFCSPQSHVRRRSNYPGRINLTPLRSPAGSAGPDPAPPGLTRGEPTGATDCWPAEAALAHQRQQRSVEPATTPTRPQLVATKVPSGSSPATNGARPAALGVEALEAANALGLPPPSEPPPTSRAAAVQRGPTTPSQSARTPRTARSRAGMPLVSELVRGDQSADPTWASRTDGFPRLPDWTRAETKTTLASPSARAEESETFITIHDKPPRRDHPALRAGPTPLRSPAGSAGPA